MHARGHGADDLDRGTCAALCHAADDARDVALVPATVTGVDALRRERDRHLATRAQAPVEQRLHEQLARAPDVCRARQDDHLVATRVPDDRLARGAQQAFGPREDVLRRISSGMGKIGSDNLKVIRDTAAKGAG